MAEPGYGVVSPADLAWSTPADGPRRAYLTDPLGATETGVDAYRFDGGDAVTLGADEEQLVIALEGSAPVALGGSATVQPLGFGRVPAGVEARVGASGSAETIVVQAPADADPGAEPTAVDLASVEFVVPATSDVATAFLTGPLGFLGMKVNARRLGPGQVVPYHTEGDQEELFVPLSGPAALRVDGVTHPMAPGSVARVAPDVPRSAVNDGDADALWAMVGAPPTGAVDWWDPGAEILE